MIEAYASEFWDTLGNRLFGIGHWDKSNRKCFLEIQTSFPENLRPIGLKRDEFLDF